MIIIYKYYIPSTTYFYNIHICILFHNVNLTLLIDVIDIDS